MSTTHGLTGRERKGLAYGLLAVASFSLSLPATRAAVADLDPVVVGLGRALVAAVFAAIALVATRQRFPTRAQIRSLAIIAFGVIVAFPLLSAWAMNRLPASHGAAVLGILPALTALAGAVRGGERPSRGFWAASLFGSAVVVAYAVVSGAGHFHPADIALLVGIVALAFGYAEGGRLARELGGWQVISWALVLSAPFLVAPVAVAVSRHGLEASPGAWLAFGYVSLVSMFLGFFAWYHGLALGGVARVSQLQLLQPFLTIVASAILLGEHVTPLTLVTAIVVFGAVVAGRRASIARAPEPTPISSLVVAHEMKS